MKNADNFHAALNCQQAIMHGEQRRMGKLLREVFPLRSPVMVKHRRGTIFGTVADWSYHGWRVGVLNDLSGKVRYWHYEQVFQA